MQIINKIPDFLGTNTLHKWQFILLLFSEVCMLLNIIDFCAQINCKLNEVD